MEAKIWFSEEQLTKAIQAAIFEQMDQRGRDKIVRQAIEYLTTPQKTHLSDNKESPLMTAFYRAARVLMEEIIQEEIKDRESEFHKAVKEVVTKGVEQWITDREGKVNQIAAKIADAIEKCLTPNRFY